MTRIVLGAIMGSLLLSAACMRGESAPAAVSKSQGWDRNQQLLWYHADQGSRLIPQRWLTALEQANSTDPFFTPANVARFGYLPPDADDRSGLPIGFAVNYADDTDLSYTSLQWYKGQDHKQPWVGMTCAACHTANIRAGAQLLRVDGAPGDGDFQTFIEQLDLALVATLADGAKFHRFAGAVLGADRAKDPENLAKLRGALASLVSWEGKVKSMNDPTEPGRQTLRYGNARLDAIGHIFNKAALLTGADDQFAAAADAPVSYPFLWNITQHDRVQWNGIAPNHGLHMPSGETFDVGAIGRNTGEMIGVFGDVRVPANYPGLTGYSSSANVSNLDAIEEQLRVLEPPAWPASLGAIRKDATWDLGRRLYKERCVACHALMPDKEGPDPVKPDLSTPIAAHMTQIWGTPDAVGTDPWMACNAFSYRMRTGRLQGTPEGYLTGNKLTMIADDRTVLTAAVAGSLSGRKADLVKAAGQAFFGVPRVIKPSTKLTEPELRQKSPSARLAFCQANAAEKLLAYKGRPLNGIWATAPYLHNGSVSSLYELLLPPAARSPSFIVGGRTLDVKNVGFVAGPGDPSFSFRVKDASGRDIPGNSNLGHDYGNAQLTNTQRYALIAYLKSL